MYEEKTAAGSSVGVQLVLKGRPNLFLLALDHLLSRNERPLRKVPFYFVAGPTTRAATFYGANGIISLGGNFEKQSAVRRTDVRRHSLLRYLPSAKPTNFVFGAGGMGAANTMGACFGRFPYFCLLARRHGRPQYTVQMDRFVGRATFRGSCAESGTAAC